MYILITCCKVNKGNKIVENKYIRANKVKKEKDNWLRK